MQQLLATGDSLDDDAARLDHDAIAAFLTTEAYWGRWRTRADIDAQIERSRLNIGVYAADGAQIGYARVLTDEVAIAYLADVYVLEQHRGRGLGKALVDFAVAHGPSRRWLLHTRDAGELYASTASARPPAT